VYGHMPVMASRACPKRGRPAKPDCHACSGRFSVLGRLGQALPARCEDGIISLYNPVALFAPGLKAEGVLPSFYFTSESDEEALEVLRAFLRPGASAGLGPYARGLL